MYQRKFHFTLTLVTFVTLCDLVLSLFDPLSGLFAGVATVFHQREKVLEYTYCQVKECCIDSHIPANMTALSHDLEENVFGQHIVHKHLIAALRSHYTQLDKSTKPLVLSFHGTGGTGKNYVADHIGKHLYKRGIYSTFIRKFLGRIDFPLESDVNNYRITLRATIIDAIKQCPRSLFIFDEVHEIPTGVFEALTSLFDHHHNVDGADLRHATFIFLSNVGGTEISEKLHQLTENGMLREETQLFHYDKILAVAAYNFDGMGLLPEIFLTILRKLNLIGGLRKASMLETRLVDHFIPFLPLEKRHAEKCIIADFKRFGVDNPTLEDIEEISSNYITYSESMYSTSGCKRLSKLVSMYADKYNVHTALKCIVC